MKSKLTLLFILLCSVTFSQIYQQSDTVYYNNLSDIGIFRGGVVYQQIDLYNDSADVFFSNLAVQPSDARKELISTIYDSLYYYRFDTLLDDLKFYNNFSIEAANLNWINPRINKTVAYNNPTWTDSMGYKGGGTAYLNENFNAATAGLKSSLNDASYGFYCWTDVESATYTTIVGALNGTTSRIEFGHTASLHRYRLNHQTNNVDYTGAVTLIGFIIINRESSTLERYYKNNTQLAQAPTATSVSIPNYNIYVLAANNGGSPASYNGNTISCFFYGRTLTAVQRLKLQEIVTYWNNNL